MAGIKRWWQDTATVIRSSTPVTSSIGIFQAAITSMVFQDSMNEGKTVYTWEDSGSGFTAANGIFGQVTGGMTRDGARPAFVEEDVNGFGSIAIMLWDDGLSMVQRSSDGTNVVVRGTFNNRDRYSRVRSAASGALHGGVYQYVDPNQGA